MCFDDLFKILAIKPLKRELYVEALTHSTYANENRGANSYEKLEFLGDSILQFKSSVFMPFFLLNLSSLMRVYVVL